MANHALLNNIEHSTLNVINTRSEQFGDNLWYSPTFVEEFYQAQAYYPILLNKDVETGKFNPVTLFGFTHEENLFLANEHWNASYIPISVKRLPFYIGWQNAVADGVSQKQRVLTIDLDSPRVSKTEGEPLFLTHGGNSEYLENMANMLEALHQGIEHNEQFIEAITALELIESATFDITLTDGSSNQLHGFYVINEDKLNQLDEKAITQLHQLGFLQAIYFIIASQANMQKLVDLKNERIAR